MRPELDDTLAAPASDPARTETVSGGPSQPRAAHGDQLVAGQQLGHFRVERRLGAGGMGEVYLATDLALDRPVALKVLPAELARDPTRRDRLIREARAQARITHPNVAHIYFIGEEHDRLYFAMELITGTTLSDRLAGGPLPVEEALDVVIGAARGLREAQRSGFTHRDVKPSNLMVDAHGVVKLLDFGLAAGEPGAATDGPVAQSSLAGTPLYMAPEQGRGEPVDHRADIYALGATLFHLVSGRPPFEGDSVDALQSKHAGAQRPALPSRGGQSRTAIAAIDALCARMMALAAADRFASYDDLLHALELASATHTRPAGLWVRAIATAIDAAFALLLCGVVIVIARFGQLVEGNLTIGPLFALVIVGYAIVATARWRRTLGQSLLELEVADLRTGGPPSARQAVLRVAIPFALPVVAMWLGYVLDKLDLRMVGWSRVVLMLLIFWVPFALLHASLRVPGKLAPWDRLTGTMVRYRRARVTAAR